MTDKRKQKPKTVEAPSVPEWAEESIADALAEQETGKRIYVPSHGKWYRWSGSKWEDDNVLEMYDRARKIVRDRAAYVNHVHRVTVGESDAAAAKRERAAAQIASSKTVAGVERLARSDTRLVLAAERFDCDPWVLNTVGGVVDLETGEIRKRSPGEYFTKCTAVEVGDAASCDLWYRTLQRITGGDEDYIDFLQRLAGYFLTGSTREHKFFHAHGSGANGKSVFVNTLVGVMGDYAVTVPADLFLEAKGERHPTELAMLRGVRLAVATELDDRRRWAMSRIKTVTGGDPVTARYMRGDFFTFENHAKLLAAANHQPAIGTVDEGVRRRMVLLPFTVTIPEHERDRNLAEKLRAEWPHILAWALQGCLDWQDAGRLEIPACVKAASDDYLENEDILGRWLDDCTARDPDGMVGSKDLHASYQAWATERGERFMGEKSLSQALHDRGYQRKRTAKLKGFAGIRLKESLF